jgi:hypothetical protein
VLCSDNQDNDNDGKIDCLDPNCFGAQGSCNIKEDTVATACTDGADNDGDNTIDCRDSDCFGDLGCQTEAGYCGDGLNNDGSGGTDCGDPDCFGDTTSCRTEPAALCNDGFDNDSDGLRDCADTADCFTSGLCGEFNCTNGTDDDADGKVDCVDSDCDGRKTAGGASICAEVCADSNRDNDGDGLADCADTDCTFDQACYESNCTDGQDGDGDGAADCNDDDCWGMSCHPAGVESRITRGTMVLQNKVSTYTDQFPLVFDPGQNRFVPQTFTNAQGAEVQCVDLVGGMDPGETITEIPLEFSSAVLTNVGGVAKVRIQLAGGGQEVRECPFEFDRARFLGDRDGVLELDDPDFNRANNTNGPLLEGRQGFELGRTVNNRDCQLAGSSFLPTKLYHNVSAADLAGDGILRVGSKTGAARYIDRNAPVMVWDSFESDQIETWQNGSCFKFYTHYTSTYQWTASPLYGGTYNNLP